MQNPQHEIPTPEGFPLQASLQNLNAEAHRLGFLESYEHLKDWDFQRLILPLSIKTLIDVHSFLDNLDADSKKVDGRKFGCQKALVARCFMAYKRDPKIDPLAWARGSLARARRTCCSCHETSSFHPRNWSAGGIANLSA